MRTFESHVVSQFMSRSFGAILLTMLLAPTAAMAVTVRVGTTNSSSDAPFFIADKKGYFKQEGIDVEFAAFDSAAKMIAPLGIGQLEVGAGSPAAGFYNAAARSINIKIVADKGSMPAGYGYLPLMIRKDLVTGGKFKDYKDLKGLTIALPAPGTTTDSTLNEALKKGGLKWDDIKPVYMGFPQHVLALQNGAIDGSVTTEPSATKAVEMGVAVRYAGGDVVYPDQQVAVVLYSDKFIKENPDVAKKFMRAYIKAVRDYNDALKDGKLAGRNADEIIAILNEKTAIKDPGVYKSITPNGVNPNGKVFEASLNKDLQFFKDRQLVKGDISVEQVLDNSFVDAVIKELGPYKPRM
jgi:NitT/TauT family transport system substrate-binding protein